MEYAVERVAFEEWARGQLNIDIRLLEKENDGAYVDELISGMFLGFVAGWKHGTVYG